MTSPFSANNERRLYEMEITLERVRRALEPSILVQCTFCKSSLTPHEGALRIENYGWNHEDHGVIRCYACRFDDHHSQTGCKEVIDMDRGVYVRPITDEECETIRFLHERPLLDQIEEQKRIEDFVRDRSPSGYTEEFQCNSCGTILRHWSDVPIENYGWSREGYGGTLCYACKFDDHIRLTNSAEFIQLYTEEECSFIRGLHQRPLFDQLREQTKEFESRWRLEDALQLRYASRTRRLYDLVTVCQERVVVWKWAKPVSNGMRVFYGYLFDLVREGGKWGFEIRDLGVRPEPLIEFGSKQSAIRAGLLEKAKLIELDLERHGLLSTLKETR